MKLSERLTILSQIINFLVFIYFTIELIKINFLDIWGLFVSALALIISVIVSIIATFDK